MCMCLRVCVCNGPDVFRIYGSIKGVVASAPNINTLTLLCSYYPWGTPFLVKQLDATPKSCLPPLKPSKIARSSQEMLLCRQMVGRFILKRLVLRCVPYNTVQSFCKGHVFFFRFQSSCSQIYSSFCACTPC